MGAVPRSSVNGAGATGSATGLRAHQQTALGLGCLLRRTLGAAGGARLRFSPVTTESLSS